MHFFYALLANVFFSAPSIIIILLYARLGEIADSSALGVGFAYAAPLHFLFSMQHGTTILADKLSYVDAIVLRLKVIPVYLLIAIALSLIYKEWVIALVVLLRCGDLIYEPYFFEKTRTRNFSALIFSSASKLFLTSFILIIAFYLKISLNNTLLMIGILGCFASFYITGFQWVERVRYVKIDWRSLLLGVSAFLASASVNVPRYFMANNTSGELAAYSNFLTLTMAGTIVFISINNLLFSRASSRKTDDIKVFLDQSVFFALAGASFSLIFAINNFYISEFIVNFIFGENYKGYSGLLPLFWIFYFLLYFQNSINCVLIYFRRDLDIFLVNACLLIALGLEFKYLGADFSSLDAILHVSISYFFFSVAIYILMRTRLRFVANKNISN